MLQKGSFQLETPLHDYWRLYEQLSVFKKRKTIGMMETGWSAQRVTRHSGFTVRRCLPYNGTPLPQMMIWYGMPFTYDRRSPPILIQGLTHTKLPGAIFQPDNVLPHRAMVSQD
ncbi:hypothetical protein TNCV_4500621 [Trichonephila clavipes]|nr:hypothetical protein TNCV_4500621 [Trichonephila clavipes]